MTNNILIIGIKIHRNNLYLRSKLSEVFDNTHFISIRKNLDDLLSPTINSDEMKLSAYSSEFVKGKAFWKASITKMKRYIKICQNPASSIGGNVVFSSNTGHRTIFSKSIENFSFGNI